MTEIRWTAEECKAMDAWLVNERGFTIEQLMGCAGARVADAAREMAEETDAERIVFLVGPGNNGGDALVARDLLADEFACEVWRPLDGDPAPELDVECVVVDGLFGVGLDRPIAGAAREAVRAVNMSDASVLAIDIPSGLSADTGQVVGMTDDDPDGGVAIAADRTLTFVGPKLGFFAGRGTVWVGEWEPADIGFPVSEAEAWVAARRAAGGGATSAGDAAAAGESASVGGGAG